MESVSLTGYCRHPYPRSWFRRPSSDSRCIISSGNFQLRLILTACDRLRSQLESIRALSDDGPPTVVCPAIGGRSNYWTMPPATIKAASFKLHATSRDRRTNDEPLAEGTKTLQRLDWLELLFLGYKEALVENAIASERCGRSRPGLGDGHGGRSIETVSLAYSGESHWTGPENQIVSASELCDPYSDVRNLLRDRLLGRSEPRGAAASWRAFQSFLRATVDSTGQDALRTPSADERAAALDRGGRPSVPPGVSPSKSTDTSLFVAPRPPHCDAFAPLSSTSGKHPSPNAHSASSGQRARPAKQDAPWRRPRTNHGADVLLTDDELRRKLRSINRQLLQAKNALAAPYGPGGPVLSGTRSAAGDSSDDEGDDDDDVDDGGAVEVMDEIEWGQQRRHSSLTTLPKARALALDGSSLLHGTRQRKLKVSLVGGESYIKLLPPEPISPLRAKPSRPRRDRLASSAASTLGSIELSRSLPNLDLLRTALSGGGGTSQPSLLPVGGTARALVLPRVRSLGLTGSLFATRPAAARTADVVTRDRCVPTALRS